MRSRARVLVAIAVSGAALGGVLGTAGTSTAACEAPAPLTFRPPVFIDRDYHGGEPVSVVANDGSIVVAAHRGTTHIHPRSAPEPAWYAGYKPQTYLWRSADGGTTWSRIEVLPGVSMHSVTSGGFSDPDLARDDAGNLYGTEGHLAHVSVFSSHDNGVTWPDADPLVGYGDRPWIAARGDGEVYLHTSYSGTHLYRSKDGGRTWTEGTAPFSGYGKLLTDPSDPRGLVLPTAGGAGAQVSRDDGNTWTGYHAAGYDQSDIPSVGIDREGWVYAGHIQDYAVRFSAWNPATRTWAQPVSIPRIGSGRPIWSWTVGGDAGRAAVGWYEIAPVPGALLSQWGLRVYVAVTTNAHGDACGPPRFSVGDAAARPIHAGEYPCSGLTCNLGPDSDRRLGDFFTINHDREGRVFVTTADTTLRDPVTGLEYQTSRPLFIGADDASPRLLAP